MRQVSLLLAPLSILAETANAYARGRLGLRVNIARPAELATL